MQATSPPPHLDDEILPPVPAHRRGRIRLAGLFTLLLILVSIAVLPPMVHLSRFQKRIARNISSALGRPVYFDDVTLTLFPQPGFTLSNFVLDEDPAFGYEPILRADQVQVTLRLSSLFRSHTEFSKIAFSSPSVNLVYVNGRWNIESLLLQAAHAQAAPTAQRFAGPARRFPYIEATGARLNLKLDQEKSPVSLTEADFALWLPQPHQWHLRLEAHPTRTDSVPGDTGTLRAEGTLGGPDLAAASLADVPINLHGDWRDAQLGGLSRLLIGRDPGLRGDFTLAFTLTGTVARNTISANLNLARARRADFVPDHPLSLEASCEATSANTFRAFPTIACHWPPSASSDPPLLALTASLPDASRIDSASGSVTLPSIPADIFFDWLAVATPHPPAVLPGAGTLTGTLNWNLPAPPPPSIATPRTNTATPPNANPALSGEIRFTGGSLILDPAANTTLALGDVILASAPGPNPNFPCPQSGVPHIRRSLTAPNAGSNPPTPLPCPPAAKRRNLLLPQLNPDSFDLQPLLLDLGGPHPATLTAHFDASGYTLHLTGTALPATLRRAAHAVPQFGDNLLPLLDHLAPTPPTSASTQASSPTPQSKTPSTSTPGNPGLQPSASQDTSNTGASAPGASLPSGTTPIPIDLTATRTWGGPQTWTDTSTPR